MKPWKEGAGDPGLAESQWRRLEPLLPPAFRRRPHPLFSLLGNSRFLIDFLARHPDELPPLLKSSYFRRPKRLPRMLAELRGRLGEGLLRDAKAVAERLRRYKYREFCRIAARDLSGLAPFEEVGEELSDLARAELEFARRAAFQLLGKPPRPPLTVIAMGKLGGNDLNFSSDVDILYLYDSPPVPLKRQETVFEHFAAIAERITRILQERTEDGMVYRVDLNLRPDGRNGPLVNSVETLRAYYEIQGGVWERVAWAKASWAAGDRRLFERCVAALQPFIYPRTTDLAWVAEIKRIKEKINAEILKTDPELFNVKLGAGGIREIEFFVGSFQLLYGGNLPLLRETGTLRALSVLGRLGMVPPSDAEGLGDAYCFLRRIENRLQMVDERQVHTLPTSDEERRALARRMGFPGWAGLMEALAEKRRLVARSFEGLAGGVPVVAVAEPFSGYWQALQAELAAESDPEERLEILRRFRKSRVRPLEASEPADPQALVPLFGELTAIAEAVLRGGYEIAWQELRGRYPLPSGPLVAVAMGKFGGRELTFGSDLDLIFLYERVEDQEFYTRLVQRIISALTLTTREGRAYRIDTDLRPSGRGGTLVSTLAAFEEYHRTSGRTWERQSLLRARPILGDREFAEKVRRTIDRIVYQTEPSPQMAGEIVHLRARMENELAREREGRWNLKTGRGGLVDIEFAVQYLQLLHGKGQSSLRTPNTLEALHALAEASRIGAPEARLLEEAYLFYRLLETRIRRVLDQPTDLVEAGSPWLGESGKFLRMREAVRSIYNAVFSCVSDPAMPVSPDSCRS